MKFAVLLLALQSSVALAADMNICSPSDYNQQKDKAATEAGRERLLLDYCMAKVGWELGGNRVCATEIQKISDALHATGNADFARSMPAQCQAKGLAAKPKT